jgi:hypothetical protein
LTFGNFLHLGRNLWVVRRGVGKGARDEGASAIIEGVSLSRE